MRIKLSLISILFVSLFFGLLSVQPAFADTTSLTGKVSDSSGVAISGATISVNDANSDSTTTDTNGNYSLSIPSGTYNVQVTPLLDSNFSSAVALYQNVSADKVLNFILTPSGTVTINGHIYDANGNPLINQIVFLFISGGSQIGTVTTDASGAYSFQISAGAYHMTVSGNNNGGTLNVPETYQFNTLNNTYNQSTTQDITLPAKKVDISVQDLSGNPMSNVVITTGASLFTENNLPIGGGITVTGSNGYNNTGITTNASGKATLWLFAGTRAYTFISTPPSGSEFVQTITQNNIISDDTSLTVVLQHPVTISGRVSDALGNGLPNQTLFLFITGGSQVDTTTTDQFGNYSFSRAPSSYHITLSGTSNGDTLNVPGTYQFTLPDATYNQNTIQNIIVPASKVNVHVQDVSGNGVNNVSLSTGAGLIAENNLNIGGGISVNGTNGYNNTSPTTDNSGNATLWLFPGTRTYTLTAVPPSNSGFSQTVSTNNTISGDTALTITLEQPITISGHILDADGQPLINQQVVLFVNGGSQVGTITTNSSGAYSFQTSSGSYHLTINGNNNGNTLHTATHYQLNLPSITYSQTSVQDITVPANKVDIHVQDAIGNPISNVTLSTGANLISEPNLTVANGVTINGTNGYNDTSLTTDSSGNATMWFFAGTTPYNIIANPPTGSIYSQFLLNNVIVSGNQSELVALQYNHATPVTTANLATQYSEGTYSDPTTVSLSATAASSYTVSNTYYKVDGGSQQTYVSPFTVTGNGSHIITYWSVDNTGVQETHNTKTFTIAARYSLTGTVYVDTNQNGFQDTGETGHNGATVTLDSGQSTTTDSNGNYSFSNLPSTTYIETLITPDGYTATTSNPATVALGANTTQNFGIAPANTLVTAVNAGGAASGNFVSDSGYSGGSTYTTSASVDTSGVTNPAPQSVYQSVRYGNFSYTIPNLSPNSAYTVRLHFNELYWTSAGHRVFNVSVNGAQALSNYNIYQAAGGANKAVIEQIPTTADSNGNVTVQFTTVSDNAMVNGIEVYSGTLPATTSLTPTPVVSEAINTGGSTVGSYLSDNGYTGGGTYTTTNSVDTSGVTNPAPIAAYQTVRYGNFSYTIPNLAPNTTYHVTLHFDEFYWGAVGQRVFNVASNNTQVLSNYDIYQAAGGANKAVTASFTTTSDANGRVELTFSSVVDNAMVSGIEISQ